MDEVQDLSPLQKALVEALTPADGSGFFGIGDPDQSIYGFRGADAGIEESLRARWPQLCVLGLTESHRSAAAILAAGHDALAGHGACGELSSVTGTSATLQWMGAPTAEREAAWIADRIAYLIGGTSHQQADLHETLAGCHLDSGSCSPGEIAVLCRIKALIPPIRAALERRGIPCSAPEADAFWTDESADALLQAAARFHRQEEHSRKEAAFLDADRFPLLAAMASAAPTDEGRKEDVLDDVPAETWAEGPDAVVARCPERFAPLFSDSAAFKRLRQAWKEHGGWPKLLDYVSFRREIDMVKGQAEYVQLMTMHASKGLEFKVVFIPGAEDGLLPFRGVGALLGKSDDFAPPPRGRRGKAALRGHHPRLGSGVSVLRGKPHPLRAQACAAAFAPAAALALSRRQADAPHQNHGKSAEPVLTRPARPPAGRLPASSKKQRPFSPGKTAFVFFGIRVRTPAPTAPAS